MRMAAINGDIFVCGSLLRVTRQGFLTAAHLNRILELAIRMRRQTNHPMELSCWLNAQGTAEGSSNQSETSSHESRL